MSKVNFKVHKNFELSTFHMKSLTTLYQPLIGSEPVSLYFTLLSLENRHLYNYTQLFEYTTIIESNTFSNILKLEEYNLITTYENDYERVHVINIPLDPAEFLDHYIYGVMYKQVVGLAKYQISKSLYSFDNIDLTGYHEVSSKFNKEKIIPISVEQVEDFFNNTKQNNHSSFDSKKLFQDLSLNVFPVHFRTNQNLQLIGNLIDLYGIDYKSMRLFLYDVTDIVNNKFDKDKLIRKAMNYQIDIKGVNLNYSLPPVVFLTLLQKGVKVSNAHKKLLNELFEELRLDISVINALIEYMFNNNDARIIPAHVKAIATTLKVNNITNENEVIKFLQNDKNGKVDKVDKSKKYQSKYVETIE